MTPEGGPANKDAERDLRDDFARLRDEERRQATPFRDVLSRPIPHQATPVRAPWVRITAAAAVLVLIAGLTISRARWYGSQGPVADGGTVIEIVDLSAATWTSPTDFLLELPSQDLLEHVPELGHPGGLLGGGPEYLIDDSLERRNRT